MAILSMSQIYALARQAGFSQDEATIASAIAMAESGGNTNAYNPSGATGLWQIDPPQANSTDPLTNAQQAFAKYKSQGWCAWAVFDEGSNTGQDCPGHGLLDRNGNPQRVDTWRNFLQAAQAVSGVTGGSTSSGGGNSGGGSNSGGGGSGSSSSGSSPQPGPVTTAAVNTFLSEFSGPIVTASAITLLILGLMLWKGQTVVKATVKGAKTAAAVAA